MRLERTLHRERRPERRCDGLRTVESGFCNADDRHETAVQRRAASDDRRIGSKRGSPKAVADHGHRARARRFAILGEKRAAQSRRLFEHVEIVARGELSPDLPGLLTGQCRLQERLICRQAGEHVILAAICFVFSGRKKTRRFVDAARELAMNVLIHAEQTLGAGRRQWLQRDSVENRENPGVDADAECDGRDRNRREAGVLRQRSRREANIVPIAREHVALPGNLEIRNHRAERLLPQPQSSSAASGELFHQIAGSGFVAARQKSDETGKLRIHAKPSWMPLLSPRRPTSPSDRDDSRSRPGCPAVRRGSSASTGRRAPAQDR